MSRKEAIILAGGYGTRLQSVVSDLPKPMAPVHDKPFLEYLLKFLSHYGFHKVVISTGYLSEKITSFFGNSYGALRLEYVKEEKPLGTGGAIKFALQKCTEQHVLVLNGDSFFDVDLLEFEIFHRHYHGMISMALRYVEDSSRFGTIEMEEDEIRFFKEKSGISKPGVINAGVYFLDNYFFMENCLEAECFSFEKDFLEQQVEQFGFFGFMHDGYFIDIGIPEDFNKAQHDFKEFKY